MAGRRRRTELPPQARQEIGTDGWPVGFDAAAYEAAAERGRRQWEEAFLRVCEQAVLKDRYFPAAMDALKLCLDRGLPLPEWLGAQIWAILAKLYAKPRNSRRYEAETRRRAKHIRRWDAVRELLDRRDELDETRDSARQTAGEYLNENADTVWSSFRLVEKAFKSKQDHEFYCAEFRLPSSRGGVRKRAKKA